MRSKSLPLLTFGIFAAVLFTSFISALTLADWTFEDSTRNPSTNLILASLNVNTGATETYSPGNAPSPTYALSSSSWDIGDNFEISMNSVGYENLILKFDEKASAEGPTQFKIQYSSDGITFNDLTGSVTSTSLNFGTNPMHPFDFSSITSIDNKNNIKLRIVSTTNASYPQGTWRIDNLRVEGTAISTPPTGIGDFCAYDKGVTGNPGDLNVNIKSVKVINGFGDKNKWLPFDEVEVQVKVDNNGNDDVDNIAVEWGLYDENTDNWIIDIDEADNIDLNNGDDQTVTFTFTLDDNMDEDLSDLEDGSNYVLYVRATGEVNNDNNDDTCKSDSYDIEMVIEKNFVILNNFEYPETVSCGSDLTIAGDIWNIGSKDQNDISVKVYNKELGISQDITIGDIDSFENDNFDATFKIPEDAKEKTYSFTFDVYDDGGDIYQNDYDDDKASFSVPIKVEGSCSTTPSINVSAAVSAVLESGGKAGELLTIKSTLTNTGANTATFILNAAGYADWANSAELSTKQITLEKGKSADITFTFDVKKDVEGDKLFNIEVVSGNQMVVQQPVSVTITKAGTSISKILGENWYLWLIGIVNVILVIFIIIIAIRVSKK